jgi:hypothetical protein
MNYIDRSRIEADWTCPRRRYWNTEYQAPGAQYRGIVKLEDATALLFGTAMHNALASTMLGLPDSIVVQTLEQDLDKLRYLPPWQWLEYRTLGLGLFWAYVKVIKPRILASYNVVAIEQEVSFMLDDQTSFMCKPDLILERKTDGTNWYPDFKTTAIKSKQWIDGWQYASQLHLGCHAVEQDLGIDMEGSMIIGLYKGYKDKDGLTRGPFTYAYHAPHNGKWDYEYVRGWDREPVAKYPQGIEHWVSTLPEEIVLEQFPIAEEIAFNRDQLDTLIYQQKHREMRIRAFYRFGEYDPTWVDRTFPQYFKSCLPAIGPACPYLDACHMPSVGEDPVGSRLYVAREPHHAPERDDNE